MVMWYALTTHMTYTKLYASNHGIIDYLIDTQYTHHILVGVKHPSQMFGPFHNIYIRMLVIIKVALLRNATNLTADKYDLYNYHKI